MGKVAFITGGNGITGSAILEYLADHTTSEEWSKIIVTSRSPFETRVQDPRVEFLALDFMKTSDSLATAMRDVCKSVTHAYFSSYIHKDDFAELNTANSHLFESFLTALLAVAPHLENVTLQTGGKYYNVHLGPVPSPPREASPRQAASIDNFYFPQEDFLAAKQKDAKWTYNVIRPEAIIGCTQKANGMNSALTFALYFLVCKYTGAPAPMPTNEIYWNGADDVSFAPLIADLTVYVSTHANCANEAFNVTNGDYFQWRYMWPRLAAYFGLDASSTQTFSTTKPVEGVPSLEFKLADWHQGKEQLWAQLCEETGTPGAKSTFEFGTWGYQDWVFQRTWSATLDVNKARKYGWTGYYDSYDSFVETFKKFESLGLIPPPSRVHARSNGAAS